MSEFSKKGLIYCEKEVLIDAIRELYVANRDLICTDCGTKIAKAGPNADAVIRALFDRLPPPGSEWPLKDRARWLGALDSVLNLIYPADFGEGIEIRVLECPAKA